ncbi:MAG: hypothetical protein KatS3mg044_1197 [Rhodothermaceae bacterium]|nr:MAG: hypothetical protein KatS3mg044_1197 [Rhodothermaceae bacterium]
MHAVDHLHRGRLDLRVAREIGSDEAAVERPVVLRVRRRVDAREAPAGPDEALHGRLLVGVEDVPGGVEEDDHVVGGEAGIREHRGVLRGVHLKVVLRRQFLQRRDALVDGAVAKAGRLREHQRPEPVAAGLGRRGRRGGRMRRQDQQQRGNEEVNHGNGEAGGGRRAFMPGLVTGV